MADQASGHNTQHQQSKSKQTGPKKNQDTSQQKKSNLNQSSSKQTQQDQNQEQPQQQRQQFNYPQYQQQESRIAPGMMKPLPEQTIVEWEAKSRPFKKKDKKFFSTMVIISLLVSLILFFAGQILPVAVIIAGVFLVYVLSVIPPDKITYKITSYGVRIEDNLYYWEELGRFWFEKKYDDDLLKIETIRFPGRLTFVLEEDINSKPFQELLSEVLINQKPELTTYEKAANWLQEKIPLETN